MFCTACAIENSDSPGFCHECGQPLSTALANDHHPSSRYAASLSRTGLTGIPILALLMIAAVFGWKEYSDQRESSQAYARGAAALDLGAYETASLEFTRAGDYRDAPEQRSAVDQLLAPWETDYLEALTAINQERFPAAITILESLQSSSPGYRDTAELLNLAREGLKTSLLNDAEIAVLERDWLTASASYNQFLALDPDNSDIAMRLAELQRQHAPLLLVRDDEIYTIGPDLADEHLITDAVPAAAAVWSPDRTRIAFLSPKEDGIVLGSLYVIDSDGANLQQLAGDAAMFPFPAWNPDGLSIAYVKSADGDQASVTISVRQVDSDREVLLQSASMGVHSLTWSPDGTRLAYIAETLTMSKTLGVISQAGDVIIVTVATGKTENLTAGAMPGAAAVEWSPAGNYLSIWESLSDTGWYGQYQSTIHLYDIDNGEWTRITNATEVAGPPAWSPTGDRLAWVQGGSRVQVRWLPGQHFAGAILSVPVTDRLVWSPDGLAILAISTDPANPSVIIPFANVAGEATLLPLAFDTSWPNLGPQWAPLTQPAPATESGNQPTE